ncbi:transglycosylase domain-containing protein [Caulobacter sp. NIBR2454]|uniref:transglycosylase domain-containing protein n=1 Tax=Caulobacter sp. NIBR2454 TaxID=3015996 RepID=UPI0022B669F3|nr:PBP1A family penicillin-binding protein [Caulobacter sp. NIBR2454]
MAELRAAAADRRVLALIAGAVAAGLLAGVLIFWVWFLRDLPKLPDAEGLIVHGRPAALRLVDRNGELLATRGPIVGERIDAATLPPHVVRAFLAAEDRRFYEHHGVDIRGLLRAAFVNAKAGEIEEGGSTLTQQLAKGQFDRPARTLKRKVQEAILARRIERRWTKDQILGLYLNRIYFGEKAYGLSGASRTYFGRAPADLTLSQAALLAALPQAPSRLQPTEAREAALKRSRLVLDRMRREGWITETERADAADHPPRIVLARKPHDGDLGWALDFAAAEARRMVGRPDADLTVRLTLDTALQTDAAAILRAEIPARRQGALVILGQDGAVRALVGGRAYTPAAFNRATVAKRQPGSAFKPFVYAAALEDGVRPGDLRYDEPIDIAGWSPENYSQRFTGEVTIADAFARSLNTVAAQLAQDVGGRQIAELSKRFGLSTLPDEPNLSVALGSYEVTLLELTGAYSVFPRAGFQARPWAVSEIVGADGAVLFRHQTTQVRVYPPDLAGQMVGMMRGVIDHGTGFRARLDRPAAGKTGTSQDYRDAWFVGFTPDFTAGVWMGDDRNRPLDGVTGGDVPALLWKRAMVRAHAGLPARNF